MLLHEHRRRHEYGDLFAAHHGFERGADGDFRLAEAYIAAEQSVHWYGLFHVSLYLPNGSQLVGCLFIRERIFKLLLPRRIGREGETFAVFALCIQIYQVFGDIFHGSLRFRFGFFPCRAVHLGKTRHFSFRTDVFLD